MPEKQTLGEILPDAVVGVKVFGNQAKANLLNNVALHLEMLQPGQLAGETVTICGCGPTLAENLDKIEGLVWATNASLKWLMKQQIGVHLAYGTDVHDGLWVDWDEAPNVIYLAASSTQTAMLKHLLAHGRKIFTFHSFRGFDWEVPFYQEHYGTNTDYIMGHGLNAVNRSVQLAMFLGAKKIIVLGGDCCFKGPNTPSPKSNRQYKKWMQQQIAYMDGRTAWDVWKGTNAVQIFYRDRVYVTRFDMAASVKDLVMKAQQYPEIVQIVGDARYSLPMAMLGKGEAPLDTPATAEELEALPQVSDKKGGFIDHIKPSLHAEVPVGVADAG